MEPTTELGITICVIGPQMAGKTSLCERLANDAFPEEYVPSFIPRTFTANLTIGEEGRERAVIVTIRDVLGNLSYERLISAAYEGCEGALVVQDRHEGDPDELPLWVNSLFNAVSDVPLVFAVNKCDREKDRVHPGEDFVRTVQSFRSAWYYTSALTGLNVRRVFEHLASSIVVKKELERFEGVIV